MDHNELAIEAINAAYQNQIKEIFTLLSNGIASAKGDEVKLKQAEDKYIEATTHTARTREKALQLLQL